MADVGRIAGVSAQTVSRYFSGRGYVGSATRARIAAVVEELGYRPHRAAGSLRARHTGTIGALTVGELVHGSANILVGLSRGARELSQTLLISQVEVGPSGEDWRAEADRAIENFLSAPVDGIIAFTSVAGLDDALDPARGQVPVINLSERTHHTDPAIPSHSYLAARIGTEHLIEQGHRRILHVAGPSTRTEGVERAAGYRDVMAEAGLEPVVVDGAADWSPRGGHAAAQTVELGSFSAVSAANDEIALGFLSAMEARGRRAPQDFSIVGIDDMPVAAYFSPPLTTVRLDFQGLGHSTLQMMHAQVRGEQDRAFPLVTPQLVVRASTAPPAG